MNAQKPTTPVAPVFAARAPVAVTVKTSVRAGRKNEQNDKRY